MNLKEVVREIQTKPTSLFYGAGVSLGCGGPNNVQLFEAIKTKFPHGKSETFFDYLEEITDFDYSNRQEIETFVKENLASITPKGEQQYLFSLPWRAMLTTNYDRIPNLIPTTIDEKRNIIPIVDPDSQIDPTHPDLLYCIKLLGDVDNSYPTGGWMVLSSNDLRYAFDRHSHFFQLFRNLSSSGHMIYLGYSFQDNLVFELLQGMKHVLNIIPWKSFAISPNEPSPEVIRKMENFGITWVKGTLQEFIELSRVAFGEVPNSSPNLTSPIIVHKYPITLEQATASNIWKKFKILDSALLESKYKDPEHFFEGVDQSLYPYVANFDFPRKTKIIYTNESDHQLKNYNCEKSLDSVSTPSGNMSDNVFLCLTGSAGSGKTVIANRLAFNWYNNGNPVIFINKDNINIDSIALLDLLDEIWEQYNEKIRISRQSNPSPLRFLIIADDCGSLLDQLLGLKAQFVSLGKPVDILLVTRKSDIPVSRLKNSNIDCIHEVDDTISQEQYDDFVTHFRKLQLNAGSEIIYSNLRNPEINTSFFALIYSSIHEVQKPMRELIKEEYENLDDSSKAAYATVALLQSYSVTAYLPMILKSRNFSPDWLQTQVSRGRLGGVIRFNPLEQNLFTNNRVVADIISEFAFPSTNSVHSLLRNIINNVTLGDMTEMQLLHLLLIDRMKKSTGRRLSKQQQEDLFEIAVNKISSGPLLLHLAKLQIESENFSEASNTLDRALESDIEGFPERDEHIVDQKGRLELRIAEKAIEEGKDGDAWRHLELAETYFTEAQINPGLTPHPYQGRGRVYLAQAKISTDENVRWAYLLLALEECNYIENYLGEGQLNAINPLIKEILEILDSDHFDEKKVTKIMDRIGKGNGYAFLAEREMRNHNDKEALKLVELGLTNNLNSLWLIRLNVLLIQKQNPNDSEKIMAALEDYIRISDTKFDPVLAFELAKETFKSGDYFYGFKLFKEIDSRTRRNPNRVKISRDNLWNEDSSPKEFQGFIVDPPDGSIYGEIECISLPDLNEKIPVRSQEIKFGFPRGGERVKFNIIFRMIGPQASRVRLVAL